jgi:hypothetical protein
MYNVKKQHGGSLATGPNLEALSRWERTLMMK